MDHQHHVVDVSNNYRSLEESLLGNFSALSGVEVLDLNQLTCKDRVDRIRALEADVVVDLAGWTGGDFQQGLLQRLAPVQVNYWVTSLHWEPRLMPGWDRFSRADAGMAHRSHCSFDALSLLGSPMNTFLSTSSVSEPSSVGHCGRCFNANRKLSDRTPRVWGHPAAAGVAWSPKANQSSDPTTCCCADACCAKG